MSRLIGRVTGLIGGGDPNQGGGGYQAAYGPQGGQKGGIAGRRERRRERRSGNEGGYSGPGHRLIGLYNSVGNTAPSGAKGGDPYGQGQGGIQDPYGPYGQQAHNPYGPQGGASAYAQPPNPYAASNSSYGPPGGAPSPYGPPGGAPSPYGPKGGSPTPGASQYGPPPGGPSPYGPQGGSSSYAPPGGPPPNPYGSPGGEPPNPYGPPGGSRSPQPSSAYAPDEPEPELSCSDFIEGLILDHPVMVFSTENSQEGAQVKQFFEQGYTGLHVEYFDIHPEDPMILPHLVDRSKTAQKYNGKKKVQNNVPFIFIDKVYIGGLKELKEMRKADIVGLLQGRR